MALNVACSNMAVTPASTASSPPQEPERPRLVCWECHLVKKACSKGVPACELCVKRGVECSYMVNTARVGLSSLFQAVELAKDIHSLAFTTLLATHRTPQQVEQTVASYFKSVNTWFAVIEQTDFAKQLAAMWENPTADTCVLVLCISVIARAPAPPSPESSPKSKPKRSPKGLGDNAYHCAKATLALVQSKLSVTRMLLQAELLIAMYEFSNGMLQQAYLSLGRCVQITKVLGWHNSQFWTLDRQAAEARDLKLCSILWWAIVHLDGLLYVGGQDQSFSMLTVGLGLDPMIPHPENFDQYLFTFGAEHGGIQAMTPAEASSAYFLSRVSQHLSNPASSPPLAPDLSDCVSNLTKKLLLNRGRACDRNAAVGTNFITLLKLNQPSLLCPTIPPGASDAKGISLIQSVIQSVGQKAALIAQNPDWLATGVLAPCWAVTMYHVGLLLVSHGVGQLRMPDWLQRVEQLMSALALISTRWKIAERYSPLLAEAIQARLGG
ncbi:hypothetical protein VTK26DRAFT_8700 [Humicola hyalothermophila]